MGNAPSQPPMSDAASSLSPRGQQRLSQAPVYMNFFEAAAVAPSAPASRPKRRPNASSDKSSTRSGSSNNSSSRGSGHEKRAQRSTTASSHFSNGTTLSEGSSTLILPSLGGRSQASDKHSTKGPKMEYATIDERRYLCDPDARYFLPCDEDESDRMVIMHFMLKYAFGGSFKAPVGDLLRNAARPRVLDIGCGPGTWVLEMASDFPNADVYGVDLVPMFPSSIKPKNAKFVHHNILKNLPFPDNAFDYVHMRLMLCNLTQAQLVHLLAEINRILKPSAFVELVDVDYRVQRPGPLCEELLNKKLYETMRTHDVDFQLCYQLSTLLMTQGGGFIDVNQDRVTIPLGWGGQLGQIHAQSMEGFFQSLHPLVRNATSVPAHPQGIVDTVTRQAMLECQKYQSHLHWYTCFGQKPAADPTAAPPPSSTAPNTPAATSTISNNSSVLLSPSSSTSTAAASTTAHTPTGNKRMAMAAGGPAIVEETWESINEFIDGYVE